MTLEADSRPTWQRSLRGASWCLVAALYAVVLYGFWLKAGADLGWDEAMNQRVYARHPLTALGLYHEPNNHVLESFFKSLFYWGLGLDSYPWRRLPGVLVGLAFLGLIAVAAWRRCRDQKEAAAIVLLLLIGSSGVFNDHALEMRGYFPSMLCAFAFLQLRRAGPAQSLRRKRVLLATALVGLVPTNLILATLLLLWAAWEEQDQVWRRTLKPFCALILRCLVLSLLFYSPILLSLALGISRFHGVEAQVLALGTAAERVFATTLPMGFTLPYWSLCLALIGCACSARARDRQVRSGLLLMLIAFLGANLVQLSLHVPLRAVAVFGIPFVLGLDRILSALLDRWPRPRRRAAILALAVLIVLPALPALIEHARVENAPRPISDLMDAIDQMGLPAPTSCLVLHEANSRLRLELEQRFGASHVAGSERELKARQERPDPTEDSGFAARLKRSLFEAQPSGLDLGRIDAVLLIEDAVFRGSHWFDHRNDWSEVLPEFSESPTFVLGSFRIRRFRR